VNVSVVPARRAFRRRDAFDTSFVAKIVSSVFDVASVVFTRVGDIVSVAFTFVVDIAFVECVSFVVVNVFAPKPTPSLDVLTDTRPVLDDDEDDDDDDFGSSDRTGDPPESFEVEETALLPTEAVEFVSAKRFSAASRSRA
jgi:hypothetical protein